MKKYPGYQSIEYFFLRAVETSAAEGRRHQWRSCRKKNRASHNKDMTDTGNQGNENIAMTKIYPAIFSSQ